MSPDAKEMADYVALLASHDWFYQYADDHTVWSKGASAFGRLCIMQSRLDPDYAIWNAKCPPEFITHPKKKA